MAIITGLNNPTERRRLGALLSSDPSISTSSDDSSPRSESSPYVKSPWANKHPSSPSSSSDDDEQHTTKHGLIGSLFRQEGHVYSLATAGDVLYTGSESKNVRVWKNLRDFSGFKSSSGLVKAIVVSGQKIFTGHQDGKIRVWTLSDNKNNNSNAYTRLGNLPKTRDLLVKSMNPKSYVKVRRKRNVPWIKHYDAVSCMSVDVDQGLLYSGSWDKTLKVWRISDSKCLESIQAHDDALNSVVVAFDGMVFTASADGTVKVWQKHLKGHMLVETLLKQDHALTSLAASHAGGTVYAGSSDGLVSFWERVGEAPPLEYGGILRGHKMAVLCVAARGSLMASGSADKSICVWRRSGGGVHTCAAVLTGHGGPVKCLAVGKETEEEESDKGWILYSGSLDKSVKIWRVSESFN